MIVGAAVPRHPTKAQPHEENYKKTSSSLLGCFGTTNKIPVHGLDTILPSPTEVQNDEDRNVPQNERSCRPPQYLQELDRATWIPGPREMQSFRYHAKRTDIGLVQQTPAIVSLILQRAIHRVRLPLHQSSDVHEAKLSLADHKVEPTGEPEVLRS